MSHAQAWTWLLGNLTVKKARDFQKAGVFIKPAISAVRLCPQLMKAARTEPSPGASSEDLPLLCAVSLVLEHKLNKISLEILKKEKRKKKKIVLCNIWDILIELSVVCLKFKFNRTAYVFSGNPTINTNSDLQNFIQGERILKRQDPCHTAVFTSTALLQTHSSHCSPSRSQVSKHKYHIMAEGSILLSFHQCYKYTERYEIQEYIKNITFVSHFFFCGRVRPPSKPY